MATIGYLEMNRGSPVRGSFERGQSAAEPALQLAARCQRQLPAARSVPDRRGHSAVDVRLSRRATPRPIRPACCARKASAVRCRRRAMCRSAWCSIRAPSATTRSTCAVPTASSASSRRNSSWASSISSTTPTENFTIKNQLFYDSMDQYKLSEQPGGGKQDVHVIEEQVHGDAPYHGPARLARRQHARLRQRPLDEGDGFPLRRRLRLRTERTSMLGDGTMTAELDVHPSVRQPRHLRRRRAVDEQLRDRVLRSGRRRAVRHQSLRAHERDGRRPLRQVARRERRFRQHVQCDDGYRGESRAARARATSPQAAATPAARGA